MTLPVRLADVRAAAARLGGRIQRTPLLSLDVGTAAEGGRLWLKCENLQAVGAFKARGALHFLVTRTREALRHGVATWSSGNHGAAVAWAAAQLGVAAEVYAPVDIPDAKAAAIERYGARLVRAGRTSAERHQAAERAGRERGLLLIPPFDDAAIIAGQGTAGLEILEQLPDVARLLAPVGGGGLLGGLAVAIKEQRPDVEIVGVEPEGAASMRAALAAHGPVEIALGETIADGLRPVCAGALTHRIAEKLVDRVLVVDDAWIRAAMRLLFESAHVVAEPSGAAALAACLADPSEITHDRTVVVLSGGNIDVGRFTALLG